MPVPGGTTLKLSNADGAPFEEFVALGIALIFERDILAERLGRAELVDHHAMVDDEVDRDLRIDLLRVAAKALHRVAHRGEVDHRGDAGEILHQHARRAILDLAVDRALLEPVGHRLEIVAGDGHAVLEAQQVFEQHLHRIGQPADVAERRGRPCRANNKRRSCRRPPASSGCSRLSWPVGIIVRPLGLWARAANAATLRAP